MGHGKLGRARGTRALSAALSAGLSALAATALWAGGCADAGPDGPELLQRVALPGIESPSGLGVGAGGLWVVSDRVHRVFRLDLDGLEVTGARVDVVDLGEADYEGVAVEGEALLVAREARGEIIRVEVATGFVVARIQPEGVVDGNDGLEGLAVAPGGDIFALKEKSPVELVRLSPEGVERSRSGLGFVSDASGLALLDVAGCAEQLLVVSQEDQRLYQVDAEGSELARWDVPARRPEGVAHAAGRLYVVDEDTDELLIFHFPGRCL